MLHKLKSEAELPKQQRSNRMAVFYNQANLTYSGGSTNSNIVTGEILEALAVTKTAVVDTYSTGDNLTYAVSIINTGGITYTDLTITDNLGAYPFGTGEVYPLTYEAGSVQLFVNGVLVTAPTVTSVQPLVFDGIDSPAGANAMLIYSVKANETAPVNVGGEINNTVTVSGGGLTTPIEATETVTVRSEPILTISKAINPTTVVDNSIITYTLTVRNLGNTDAVATDNLVISDTFDPILSDITVLIGGNLATEGTDYTYNETTGEFATVGGVVTVPAGTFTQNPITGEWTVTPGETVVEIRGRV